MANVLAEVPAEEKYVKFIKRYSIKSKKPLLVSNRDLLCKSVAEEYGVDSNSVHILTLLQNAQCDSVGEVIEITKEKEHLKKKDVGCFGRFLGGCKEKSCPFV